LTGQLYKISGAKIDPAHDPSGDCVYSRNIGGDVCGFVLRRCDDGRLLILLFKSEGVPVEAEVILHYCDAVSVLREEVARNPVLEQKMQKIKFSYGKS
jgi:hypothetical protein